MKNILLFAIAVILSVGIYIIDKNMAELIKISTPEYVNAIPGEVIKE